MVFCLVRIGFLGPKTTFSHIAALKIFPNESFFEFESIQKIFQGVAEKKIDFGVVPIENSTSGTIALTLDELLKRDLKIAAQTIVPIEQYLLAKTLQNGFEKILSKPEAFEQCGEWLQKNYPNAELVAEKSTACAAEIVSKSSEKIAAIASKGTAEEFGLKIIAKNIEDAHFNQTRFIAIGAKELPKQKNQQLLSSIVFAVKDKPGALFDAIESFKKFNVNMIKIESRPSKKASWEYVFFVDLEGGLEDVSIKKALNEMKEHCASLKILGSYPIIK